MVRALKRLAKEDRTKDSTDLRTALDQSLEKQSEKTDLLELAHLFNQIGTLGEEERNASSRSWKYSPIYARPIHPHSGSDKCPNKRYDQHGRKISHRKPSGCCWLAVHSRRSIPNGLGVAALEKAFAWQSDSGVEYDHPALGDCVRGGVIVEFDAKAKNQYRIRSDDKPTDVSGHGTACAGIIHSIAPEAEIYSVRVLGRNMGGRAIQFAARLDWAIENDMQIVNLSLSTSLEEDFGLFHDLTDQAYFKNMSVISAVNNIPEPSYPSLYSRPPPT